MIRTRLCDGGLYDIKEGDTLIVIRRTDHGDIKEARMFPYKYPDLLSGTEVIVRGIMMDTRGTAWLKCEVPPEGVIYKLNSLHLDET